MVEITRGVHSIDELGYPVPNVGFISYIVEEKENDLTLIDTCFKSELPTLEKYVKNAGYELKQIRRIILTHLHPDHVQATNELRKKVAKDVKIYAHWIDASYLSQSPIYHGPPSHEQIKELYGKFEVKMEDLPKRFGSMRVDPIHTDEQIQDGDAIGSLKVIHTPGHTPGHISLYSEKHRIIFGADFLFKSVFGTEGLFIPHAVVSIDPVTAAISAERISKVNFDKLLLAHQDSPVLENAQKEVEKAAVEAIKSLKDKRHIAWW
jgi:glyoxylase-like metal-dependent hydrolase (beta-lactamase superfamily II)